MGDREGAEIFFDLDESDQATLSSPAPPCNHRASKASTGSVRPDVRIPNPPVSTYSHPPWAIRGQANAVAIVILLDILQCPLQTPARAIALGALSIMLDVEQPLYEATTLLNAASLLHRCAES